MNAETMAEGPVFSTASQLAQDIRSGRLRATEVLEAHLDHIARHNPTLNAIVTLDEKSARQRAKDADQALDNGEIWGALHGVPVTIKDTYETAGIITTASDRRLANYVPEQDATVVARLRAAGAVILGKTNMPWLAMDWQSNSPVFGRANNPWDVSRTPGGSTGGGAAAVAAGLSPVEFGSDAAGSIRIPAHFCGIFGLKTTEHRVSLAGHIPEPPGVPRSVRHIGVPGILARSIEDLQLSLAIIAGPDNRQWEVPPVPVQDVPPPRLRECRFALTEAFDGVPVTSETKSMLERFAQSLVTHGCHVEHASPPEFDFADAWQTWAEVFGAEVGATASAVQRLLMRAYYRVLPGDSPLKRGFIRALRLNMPSYVRALTRRDALITAMEQFLSGWDAWLCPVSAGPAFTHRKFGARIAIGDQMLPYEVAVASHATILSLTGNPVVVLPLGRSKENLPIGVQVVGRRWRDMNLLALAGRMVRLTGGFERPPGY